MTRAAFRVVQLWDASQLSHELFSHVARDQGSMRPWVVRGAEGPSMDPGYGPENYDERHLRLDREVDDYLVNNGAVIGSEIVWHI